MSIRISLATLVHKWLLLICQCFMHRFHYARSSVSLAPHWLSPWYFSTVIFHQTDHHYTTCWIALHILGFHTVRICRLQYVPTTSHYWTPHRSAGAREPDWSQCSKCQQLKNTWFVGSATGFASPGCLPDTISSPTTTSNSYTQDWSKTLCPITEVSCTKARPVANSSEVNRTSATSRYGMSTGPRVP